MRMPRLSPIIVSLALPLLGACATVEHGRYQRFPVNSSPSGADVVVNCNGHVKDAGPTPVVVTLKRKANHCTLTLTKDGYEPMSIVTTRRVSGWVWGNLIYDQLAVPFALIDYFDGAAFEQETSNVQFMLTRQAETKSVSR